MLVVGQGDAGRVLDVAASFLARDPVEHNTIWQVLEDHAGRPTLGRYWWVADGDAVVGVAMEAPRGARASITPMPPHAARALALAIEPPLRGVYGEAAAASAFAAAWTTSHQVPARPVDAQVVRRLDEVADLPAAAGHLRAATPADRPALVPWSATFLAGGAAAADGFVDRSIADGKIWVWQADEVVAMACAARPVGGVARIFGVYTHPAHRRHGYGTSLVAELSRSLVGAALRATLAVRLNNPGANGIYERIGFAAGGTVLAFDFDVGSAPPPG